MHKISFAIAAILLAGHASAAGYGRTVLIDGSDVHDYHFTIIEDSYGIPTEHQMNMALQGGQTVRVCLVEEPSKCGYLVPADRLPKTHTEYVQDTQWHESIRWQWNHHSNPADYWKQGMQYRICPIVVVDSPDMKPECRIQEQ